jgi:hypothetical protein
VDHLPLLRGDVEPLPPLQRPLLRAPVVSLDQPGAIGGQPLDDGVVADAQLTQEPARPAMHEQREQVVQRAHAPVAFDRVLLGLLAGQLGKRGRGGGWHRHRLQRLDRHVLHDLLGVGQGGQLLSGLLVADALPAQPATVVEPPHGNDQVLGAHVGGARLGGDAVRVREQEPQGRVGWGPATGTAGVAASGWS